MLNKQKIIKAVSCWVETVVVGLHLCPFAKREVQSNSIHYAVSEASTEEALLENLEQELKAIIQNLAIETTILIHPNVLQDFYDYNQFLDYADALLVQMELDGIYQIASFHPEYQFADTEADDVRNYTNKSPYPMLHIILEESVAKAIASYPDIDQVPVRNQQVLENLGSAKLQALMQACFNNDE